MVLIFPFSMGVKEFQYIYNPMKNDTLKGIYIFNNVGTINNLVIAL